MSITVFVHVHLNTRIHITGISTCTNTVCSIYICKLLNDYIISRECDYLYMNTIKYDYYFDMYA